MSEGRSNIVCMMDVLYFSISFYYVSKIGLGLLIPAIMDIFLSRYNCQGLVLICQKLFSKCHRQNLSLLKHSDIFQLTFLLIEKFGVEKILSKAWKPFRIAYTLLIVMVGWVFFRADTLTEAGGYLSRMFFIPSDTHLQILTVSEFMDAKVAFILVFAIIYSFRLFKSALSVIETIAISTNNQSVYSIVFQSSKFLISISLIFIALVYLASGTYNPFIYFRF